MRIIVGLIEHIGDIIACEPVARYLKKTYPLSDIAWVVLEQYRELIDTNPFIDKTVIVECLTEWMRLVKHGKCDLVVDLHVNYRVCPHCRIPLYKTAGNRDVNVYEWFDYGSILKAFSLGAGLPGLDDQPSVHIGAKTRAKVNSFGLGANYAVIHTKSNEKVKDWQTDRWRKLVDWLIRDQQIKIVEVGKRVLEEQHLASRELKDKFGHMFVDLRDQTSILETAEIIRRARIFVGVDSGPAHMANASKVPGVVLLGRIGVFRRYMPFSGYYASDSHDVKMVQNLTGPVSEITADEAIEAIKYVLAVRSPLISSGGKDGVSPSIAKTKGFGARPPLSAPLEAPINGALPSPVSPAPAETAFPKLFAFYLPQFHPIQENNFAHGLGFSEWTNVIKTTPLFKGHYQPRTPGELGYYDLRSLDVMRQQIDLAVAHGVTGFCFYFYYFKGKKLLYRPIENYIRSDIKAPFCFLWANENWTKRWDGGDNEIIIQQQHSIDDDRIFIHGLMPIFDDDRYLKIDGKPVLLVYKAHLFPNVRQTTEVWRNEMEKVGYQGIYLIVADDWQRDMSHPRDYGFDASYEIPSNITPKNVEVDDQAAFEFHNKFEGRIVDYYKFSNFHLSRPFPKYKRFRTVMLPWDNTPRYGNRAIVHVNTENDAYKVWLEQAYIDTFKRFSKDERIVFVHSWNEWCEGTYLEPDGKVGRKYLEQTKEAIEAARQVVNLYRDINLDAGALALRLEKHKEEGAFRTLEVTRATIHDMRREIDHLRHVAGSADDLRQEVDQLRKDVNKWQQAASSAGDLKGEVEHLRREANRWLEVARENEVMNITIAQLLQSNSWRVTAPLRALSGIIRRRRQL